MPSFAQALAMAFAGCCWRVESGPATWPCAPISASHSSPSSSALALLMITTAQAPSEICEAEPAVMVPSLLNAGRSLPSDSTVVSPRMPSSAVTCEVSAARLDRHGHDLVVEDAVLPGLGGALVRAGREGVLLLAGQVVGGHVALLGQHAHRLGRRLVPQGVVGHRVDECGVAVLEALAGLRQQVRRLGHRLHAAGDDDLDLARADQLVGQRDRVDAREADLVDGDARDVHRDAARDRGGARRVLPGAGQDDLAHDHVVDLVAGDAGLLERAGDGDAAEVRGGLVLEPAEQPADRRTGAGDDDGSGHGCLLQSRVLLLATIPTGSGEGRGREPCPA